MAISRAVRVTLGLALSGIAIWALPASASAATISGTVTGAGQGTLEGAQVCAWIGARTGEEPCTQTDAAGSYALPAPATGEYKVLVSDRLRNRNFVDHFVGGSAFAPGGPGTGVAIASVFESHAGVDIELEVGSTIEGTVTDADTGDPISGIFACPEAEQFPGVYQRCDETGVDGKYQVNGLPTAGYRIDFQPGFQNYQEKEFPPIGEPKIEIAHASEVIGPIDFEMDKGAEVSGALTEAGTGKPVVHMLVEIISTDPQASNRQAFTDVAGHYNFRALPEGEFVVVFSPPKGPFGSDADGYGSQWWKGSPTREGATVLHLAPPAAVIGIDGQVVNLTPPPPPLKVTLLPGPSKPNPPRCRKGFHKKKIKGKQRCVKVHKKKHNHRHAEHR
ncbi:MAG TPA: carboxypeptidase-like regulatory domain-containing protein [Solirubrobacterales bacterium]|nr:carboxypeptidase-like regulatory domain-containing protein [Solirubrobacterales bacterium]